MNEQQAPVKIGLLKFLRESVGSQFVIPVYQRNYTWTYNKEVKQYFEDLENVITGKFDKHFMGILIYLDKPITYSSREFSVIDGQQRLTTTFLILYAMKELMMQKGLEEDAKCLDAQFLTNQFVPDKLKFKLKPLVADDEVYKQIINNEWDEITATNSNVYKNYKGIKNNLLELLKTNSFNDILMGLDKLYVVCIPVAESDNPQKIFESINSTGAKLVASDLIRNYLLMNLESDIQEQYYNTYWKKLEEYISTDSKKLEAFFRMFLACKNKVLSNITAVYSDFKQWYANEITNGNSVEDILKSLVRYAKCYNAIYNKPIAKLDKGIQVAIQDFRKNLSEMPAPFLMEVYSLYDSYDEEGNRVISSLQLSEILTIINIYLLRRAICGLDTSDITRLFPLVLKDVMNDCKGDYAQIVEYLKKNLINKQRGKSARMPDDEMLRNVLKYENVYNLRVTLRVIFDKIETFNNPAPVDLSKLSVEHLMPQTPTKEWIDALNIDEATYERNLHRLGNLTLATKPDNSKMKNKPWDYKKAILADTAHLTMNQEILKKKEWSVDEIDSRTKELIEQIIEFYPYCSASDEVISKHVISINCDGVSALAYLYEEDGSVEVQEGSEIVKYDPAKAEDWPYDLYNSLLEEGIIKETDKGAVFVKTYMFLSQWKSYTALSSAAGFILCGSRNGWEYWKDENGNSLNENSELKLKLTGK
ncbi:MAG: DUF4357 domain-containing protein [Clostridia bacterium]|nr:DUF4357 domain-containing protein [Clostridia bacterium]